MKKSFELRAAQIRQLGVAESRRIRDMPSIRLLDLTNLVPLSPSKHFFNGLVPHLKVQGELANPVIGATRDADAHVLPLLLGGQP